MDPVDLSSVALSHYRLSKHKEQHLKLVEDAEDTGLEPTTELGTGKARDKDEELLSKIIQRLNEAFANEDFTENDNVNYVYTLRDKVIEDTPVMHQINHN